MKLSGASAHARREFLHYILLTGASCVCPDVVVWAKSGDVDLLQTAEAIITIYDLVRSRGRTDSAILLDIDGKLDVIIRNQEAIMQQLHQLRIELRQELEKAFISNDVRELISLKDTFDVVTQERISARTRPLYEQLYLRALSDATKLATYDVGVFVAFGSAVGMSLFLQRALGMNNAQRQGFTTKCIAFYNHWLDGSNPGGITAAITTLEQTISSGKAALNNHQRDYVTHNDRVPHGGQDCRQLTTLHINGDFEHGYTATTSLAWDDCHEPPPPGSGCKHLSCLTAEKTRAAARLQGRRSSLKIGNLLPVEAERFTRLKADDPLGEMNGARNTILTQMDQLARLQVIRDQIVAARNVLSRP